MGQSVMYHWRFKTAGMVTESCHWIIISLRAGVKQSLDLVAALLDTFPSEKPHSTSLASHNNGWDHCVLPGLSSLLPKFLREFLISSPPLFNCIDSIQLTLAAVFQLFCRVTSETLKYSCSVSSDSQGGSVLKPFRKWLLLQWISSPTLACHVGGTTFRVKYHTVFAVCNCAFLGYSTAGPICAYLVLLETGPHPSSQGQPSRWLHSFLCIVFSFSSVLFLVFLLPFSWF